jgi:hypothetical protein
MMLKFGGRKFIALGGRKKKCLQIEKIKGIKFEYFMLSESTFQIITGS